MYWIGKDIIFPDPKLADTNGVLALGGDLSPDRLLFAYEIGVFPWFNEDEPIIWWAPNPRFVMFLEDLKVSKSMRPILRSNKFQVTYDKNFAEVMDACRYIKREGQQGASWITQQMLDAYTKIHEMGYAHSVEVWQEGELVGGLYGVSLGKCFFGESMFWKVSNASKIGFIHLVHALKEKGYWLIDCQNPTKHLSSLGASNIPRSFFTQILEKNKEKETKIGKWTEWL